LNESREREIFKVRDSVRLRVQSVEELSKVIIPHYLKYPLITNKQALAADRSSDVSPPPPLREARVLFFIYHLSYMKIGGDIQRASRRRSTGGGLKRGPAALGGETNLF